MRAALLVFAAALPIAAQPAKLVNAKIDTREASGGLEAAFRPLLTSQPQPAWIGYMVAASKGRQFGCNSYWRDGEFAAGGGTVYLEPPSQVLVLYRVEGNHVGKIRTLAPECDIDAGGAPVHWLTGVKPSESVALLASLVNGPDLNTDSVMNAIGMHGDPAADAALERFAAGDQPERVRERAVTWLGLARGGGGLEVLKKILAADSSDRIRERAVQALAMSRDAAALDVVIAAAKNDRSPRVRGQALSWLSREAGAKAVGPIRQAIENDPEREVKRRAVSALQQMPNGEGVPLLIEIARTSRDPEVRKQAMNSLGQSRDQRAVAFFEQVLKQ